MANWALIIGINQYQRLRSLRFAERDAQLMREYCQQENFQKIFYFADTSPPFLAADGSSQETRPTYGNLRAFLRDFFEHPNLEAGDNFWFFFSGHGIRHQERDYLLPCDGNPRDIEYTAIGVNYITERLRGCGAGNIVLFLDACRDDSDKSGLGIGLEKHQGVITISSCAPLERSYEIEELQQGAFTCALLESLRIQGEGNCATVERLYQRLRYRVTDINRRHNKPQQTPYAIAEPASKYHLVLVSGQATLQDIAMLKLNAYEAAQDGNLALAEQLWTHVLAVSPADPQALKALRKIWTGQKPTVSAAVPPLSTGMKSPAVVVKGREQTSLATFPFEIITVNERGKIINKKPGEAAYYREDLGNGVSLDMVQIPGGRFIMGAPEEEKGRYDWEGPQHEVTIAPSS